MIACADYVRAGLGYATLAEHGAVCPRGSRVVTDANGDEVCVPGDRSGVDLSSLGMGSPLDLAGAVSGGFAFRSNVSPEITWTPGTEAIGSPTAPAGSSTDGSLATFGGYLQPTLEGILPDGSRYTLWAPYGEATGDYRVYVGGVLVAVAGSAAAALALAYFLGKRSRGRR